MAEEVKLAQICGAMCIEPFFEVTEQLAQYSNRPFDDMEACMYPAQVTSFLLEDSVDMLEQDTYELDAENASKEVQVNVLSCKTYQYAIVRDIPNRDPCYSCLIINKRYKRTYVIDFHMAKAHLSNAKIASLIMNILPSIKEDCDALGLSAREVRIVVISSLYARHRTIGDREKTFRNILSKLHELVTSRYIGFLDSIMYIDTTLVHSFIPRRSNILVLATLESDYVHVGGELNLSTRDIPILTQLDPLCMQAGLGKDSIVYMVRLTDGEHGGTLVADYRAVAF